MGHGREGNTCQQSSRFWKMPTNFFMGEFIHRLTPVFCLVFPVGGKDDTCFSVQQHHNWHNGTVFWKGKLTSGFSIPFVRVNRFKTPTVDSWLLYYVKIVIYLASDFVRALAYKTSEHWTVTLSCWYLIQVYKYVPAKFNTWVGVGVTSLQWLKLLKKPWDFFINCI